MHRLRMRVYQVLPGRRQWALLGSTDLPELVIGWIEENEHRGLIVHTGTQALVRDQLAQLAEMSHEGIVCCMGSLAVLHDLLPLESASPLKEVTHSLVLTQVANWFFILSPGAFSAIDTEANAQDVEQTWCLSRGNGLALGDPHSGEDMPVVLDAQTLAESPINADLKTALVALPEHLSLLVKSKVYTLDDLREQWHTLPYHQVIDIFHALIAQQQRRNECINQVKPLEIIAQAVIDMASVMPPWDEGIPDSPVRLRNALMSKRHTTLWTVSKLSVQELMRIPNIGRKSLFELKQYLQNYQINSEFLLENPVSLNLGNDIAQPACDAGSEVPAETRAVQFDSDKLASLPTLVEALHQIRDGLEGVSKFTEKELSIVELRWAGETLENIAQPYSVTRERIRQIISQTLNRISDLIVSRSVHVQPLLELGTFFRWVIDNKSTHQDLAPVLKRVMSSGDGVVINIHQMHLLEVLFRPFHIQFSIGSIDNTEVYLPIPLEADSDDSFDQETLLKKILPSINGLEIAMALEHVREMVLKIMQSQGVATVLAHEAIYKHTDISEDGICHFHTNKIIEIGQQIVHILRKSGRPLHYIKEIYPAMSEAYKSSVSERRVNGHIFEYNMVIDSLDADYILPLGRSQFSLWEHMGLDDTQGQKAAQMIETYLNEYPDRQFSDMELAKWLSNQGILEWNPYDRSSVAAKVRAILQRYKPARARNLGRFSWRAGDWTDRPDSDARIQVNETITDYIKEKGRPVLRKDALAYLSEVRGMGHAEQVHDKNGVITLRNGSHAYFWHEDLDPINYNEPEVEGLRREIVEIIRLCPEGIFMRSLKADITQHQETTALFNDTQFLALLLRMPEATLNVEGGQYKVIHTTG